jgi:hypothetical protein
MAPFQSPREFNRDTKSAILDVTFSMASVPGREFRIQALTLAVWERSPFFHNTSLSLSAKSDVPISDRLHPVFKNSENI